jgi:hypothetical protein
MRIEAGLLTRAGMSRNAAVARIRVNGREQIIGRLSDATGHSEELLAADIAAMRSGNRNVEVLQLFTERAPCTNTGGCRAMIAEHMAGVDVFCFTRNRGNAAMQDLWAIYGH